MNPPPGALPAATPRHQALTVIFKGSNRCNAGCTFCSVGEAGGRVVSQEDFETVVRELERLTRAWGLKRLQFTFHGGEPTLLGPRFIDQACQRLGRLPIPVSFNMQSNLLHWDDELAAVLVRHDVVLGTSVDPVARDRLDARGRDAYPTWLANYLKVAKVMRAPGAIFVVTRNALGRARELHDAAQAVAAATGRRFGLQINPVYRQGRAVDTAEVNITPAELGEFLVELWRAWDEGGQSLRLTPIQDFSDHFFPVEGRTPRLSCSFRGRCAGTHVGIDFDLNVAACGRRLDSKAYIGNLRERPLVEILDASEELRAIATRDGVLRAGPCAECRFFELCHGGCVDDAVLSSGQIADRFHWCEGYRMLFEAMEAERARRPADSPPRRLPVDRAAVHVVREPGELPAYADRGDSVWLLPSDDGRALRFGSGLDRLLGSRVSHKLVFVPNRQVRSLALWERALRADGAAVVLYEREGFEAALELLNKLRARVILDVPRLLEAPDGAELLGALVEQFVFERSFAVEVQPLSALLLRAVGKLGREPGTRFGLRPGSFDLRPAASIDGQLDASFAAMLASARQDGELAPHEWLAGQLSCPSCAELPTCAGQLAPQAGLACSEAVKRLAGRLRDIGLGLREQLQGTKAT